MVGQTYLVRYVWAGNLMESPHQDRFWRYIKNTRGALFTTPKIDNFLLEKNKGTENSLESSAPLSIFNVSLKNCPAVDSP